MPPKAQRTRKQVWVSTSQPQLSQEGLGSPPPTSRRRQPSTSYLPWVLETRCSISQWGVGTGRQRLRVSLTPYMFLPLGWQSLWGEVSDLPWQDAGNRKPGRSAGGVLTPLRAVSPRAVQRAKNI